MGDMTYSIKLGFLTAEGKTAYMTVPRANSSATGSEVRAAMQGILNAGVVIFSAGAPVSIESADLVVIDELVYDLGA